MYFNGEGGPADVIQAYVMWEKASELGHLYAKRNVGLLLLSGRRGASNIPKGLSLYLSSIFATISLLLKNPNSERLM